MGEARPFGRYFEDFEVGDVYKHWPGKTITEYDDHLFCMITMNHHTRTPHGLPSSLEAIRSSRLVSRSISSKDWPSLWAEPSPCTTS